jgi:hypothetical protein
MSRLSNLQELNLGLLIFMSLSASLNGSTAGSISGVWKAPLTGSLCRVAYFGLKNLKKGYNLLIIILIIIRILTESKVTIFLNVFLYTEDTGTTFE